MKSLAILLLFMSLTVQEKNTRLAGAWQYVAGNEIHTVIFSDKFYSVAEYNLRDKKFISTYGGSWYSKGDRILFREEFNTVNTDNIGSEKESPLKFAKGMATMSLNGKSAVAWKQIDKGEPGLLAGAWLITGRKNDGEMSKIVPGARRTMKIMSGTRFQWIAYNTETKEFFGTGGGNYKTESGKYTENIEFFSRDNSRTGSSLQFDFAIEEGNWHHQGLSSKGDPIDEIWTKREVIGL